MRSNSPWSAWNGPTSAGNRASSPSSALPRVSAASAKPWSIRRWPSSMIAPISPGSPRHPLTNAPGSRPRKIATLSTAICVWRPIWSKMAATSATTPRQLLANALGSRPTNRATLSSAIWIGVSSDVKVSTITSCPWRTASITRSSITAQREGQ